MKPYTVILLYPEYMTDGRVETYFAHVEAENLDAAARLAQEEAARENHIEDEYDEMASPQPGEFDVLFVFDGHQYDAQE